jgi:hypothetical protein
MTIRLALTIAIILGLSIWLVGCDGGKLQWCRGLTLGEPKEKGLSDPASRCPLAVR